MKPIILITFFTTILLSACSISSDESEKEIPSTGTGSPISSSSATEL